MAKTIVGAFDDSASAQSVVRELKELGIPENQLRLTSSDDAERAPAPAEKQSWSGRIYGFFESLFEDEEDRTQAHAYAEAWRRGHCMVVADVDDAQAERTVEIMNRYGSVNLDQRAAYWKKSGYQGSYDVAAPAYTAEERARELAEYTHQQQESIPVVQEELAVGKRVVQRGGVRIHSYVEELPVAELIRLREESLSVARRPVDRPATETDAMFQERTVEVTAEGEEPVIEKRARVVEEVTVGKDVEEREETVRDTVRRKDVEVEPVVASKPKSGAAAKPATPTHPEPRR